MTSEEPRAGLPLLANHHASLPTAPVRQMVPGPSVAPAPTIMGDHKPWREVVGEPPPGTAASRQLAADLETCTVRGWLRSAPRVGRGHERLKPLPCAIREVG